MSQRFAIGPSALGRRALILLLALLTTPAFAQPSAAQGDLDRGLRSYAVGQYAEAIAAFRAGYQLEPRPELLYALAQAERMSGDCKAAIETYHAFLRTHPSAAATRRTQENLDRCQTQLAVAPSRTTLPEAAKSPPAIAAAPSRPRRSWARDPAGASLTAIGLALAASGGALWGAGQAAVVSANGAARYGDFSALQASGLSGERERIAGIVTLAIGGAALVAGIARWTFVARSR